MCFCLNCGAKIRTFYILSKFFGHYFFIKCYPLVVHYYNNKAAIEANVSAEQPIALITYFVQ